MEKSENIGSISASADVTSDEEVKNKPRIRGKKRKRKDSDSSTDIEDMLPENTLEVEKNLQASAIKNNLDDVSVKKILKKVVTNDHVLALVKLREEEEDSAANEQNLRVTRAKARELIISGKVSPKSATLNYNLTPIKHIPVKIRPEVEALIAAELPEDEDDDEYQPTHEDVPSDDDQTLESCSDLESQPATPATPKSLRSASPKILKDGPFKVPQELSTPTRRKLVLEEEATIALRTRSKLSLSATPIEHIESSFVPPDDLPKPVVDDLWNQFLEECLNPASVTRNEEDDEADPEYNVAADPDAHDEDEEALENSIIKISKKELDDLVTELLGVMPEETDEQMAEDLSTNVLAESQTEIPSRWDGKLEPKSDEEPEKRAGRIFEKRDSVPRISIGKTEPDDPEYNDPGSSKSRTAVDGSNRDAAPAERSEASRNSRSKQTVVNIAVVEKNLSVLPAASEAAPPPLLRGRQRANTEHVVISLEEPVSILPEQIQILQQQLRQHVQLAASNFLQLFVNPIHWSLAPTYKEYLEQFKKMVDSNPNSVVKVCNLMPAVEFVESWEKSVSEDTPENQEMVEFIQNQAERCRRRIAQNSLYAGDFHPTLMRAVANSGVFLYPYLLPAMPYRADNSRKFGYRRCEDRLIVLGLDQFWQYVEDNPRLYKCPARPHPRRRWGLRAATHLLCKHLLPWISPRWLLQHMHKARKDKESPIYKFFENREVEPVKHKLLPFNPNLTLYEHPEHEMPRIWVRFLAKTSKRFRDYLYLRKNSGNQPLGGIEIEMGKSVQAPEKPPLPIDFTKTIISTRANLLPKITPEAVADKYDIQIEAQGGSTDVLTPNFDAPSNIVAVNDRKVIVIEPQCSLIVTPSVVKSAANITPPNKSGSSDVTLSYNTTSSNAAMNNNSKVIAIVPQSNTVKTPSTIKSATNVSKYGSTDVPTSNIDAQSNNDTKHMVIEPQRNVTTPSVESAANIPQSNQQLSNILFKVSTANNDNKNGNTQNEAMYKLVETDKGAFLMPVIVVRNVNTPKPVEALSAEQTNLSIDPNVNKEISQNTRKDDTNHCTCCLLLRKICKEKQTRITDFWRPNNEKKPKCKCTFKRYPRVSKKLKMLVSNYKSQSWSVHKELQRKLNIVKNETKDDEGSESEMETDSSDICDIASVASYQMKLTIRSSFIRNTHLKKHINSLFSKFDPDFGDPLDMANTIYKAFGVEMADLYTEFLGFLTAEQADKIGRFKEYFVLNCVTDLIKRVEEEVSDKASKTKILSHINNMLVDAMSTSCESCSALLRAVGTRPVLARHVFSLFPHNAITRDRCKPNRNPEPPPNKPLPKQTALPTPPVPLPAQKLPLPVQKLPLPVQKLPLSVQIALSIPPIVSMPVQTALPTSPIVSLPVQNLLPTPRTVPLPVQTVLATPPTVSLPIQTVPLPVQTVPLPVQTEPPLRPDPHDDTDEHDDALTICEEPVAGVDYEADHSSSDDENGTANQLVIEQSSSTTADSASAPALDTIKSEEPTHHETEAPQLEVNKTEAEDYSESSDMSTLAMSDDEPVKSEIPEWSRDEDKLILQVLLEQITPANNKTFEDLVETKHIAKMIAETLTHKSFSDVRERVSYLMDILLLSTKSDVNISAVE